MTVGWYLVDFARGRPTNPARIPVNASVAWYQMALHEIGHALGLRDVSDPNSVMYYAQGASNQNLDGTDIAAIQRAYTTPTVSASSSDLSRLSQAMMTFGHHA